LRGAIAGCTHRAEMTTAPPQAVDAAQGGRAPVVGIVAVSGAAIAFLLWLLYVHKAPPEFSEQLRFLPLLNAVLNGCAALSLVAGFSFIKQRRLDAHRNAMITAFVFSSLFLLGYIAHHALHGDSRYPGHSMLRTFYLVLLASHVLLSVVALPVVLTTFFFALTTRFSAHKKLARVTFPVWLYVSVTGVLVYVLLSTAR
jgi:putative membrane protein